MSADTGTSDAPKTRRVGPVRVTEEEERAVSAATEELGLSFAELSRMKSLNEIVAIGRRLLPGRDEPGASPSAAS